MRKEWPSAVKTLATNLDRLLTDAGMSDRAAEKECGVGHKTINNMRHGRHAPELDTIEKVAKIFGMQAWMLLVPDINPALLRERRIHSLLDHYVGATEHGQETIDRVAESVPRRSPPEASLSLVRA